MFNDIAETFWIVYSPLIDWLAGAITAFGLMLAIFRMSVGPIIKRL